MRRPPERPRGADGPGAEGDLGAAEGLLRGSERAPRPGERLLVHSQCRIKQPESPVTSVASESERVVRKRQQCLIGPGQTGAQTNRVPSLIIASSPRKHVNMQG